MPSDRDQEIYKGIIKSPNDFFRLLEIMLTDTPLQYISTEILHKEHTGNGIKPEENLSFPNLYVLILKLHPIRDIYMRKC